MESIKQVIRNAVRPFGLAVMKHPTSPFRPIRIFDLCVQFLMSVRGPELRFVQVGANDGVFDDPLRKYILNFPWRGILVEPQPDVFDKLRANYTDLKDRLIFENAAIAADAEEISMYRPKPQGSNAVYAASVSSMDEKLTARQLGLKKGELERISVPCLTLDKLIERHTMPEIDLLQIDTEGYDFQVLRTLNLAKYSPLVIQFEHGQLKYREVDEVVQYLSRNNYSVLYGGRQIDTVAIHASFPLQSF
jgi:methyltransferase, FkbM family